MNPLHALDRIKLEHAGRHNIAALHFGTPWPVTVGTRRFTLQFEPCLLRYPLRLHGKASGQPFALDCDAQALFPELSWQALTQTGAAAHRLIADAFDDWLCALEGVFGVSIEVDGATFDTTPEPGAYGLCLTHSQSGRSAHFSFHCDAVDRWLQRRAAPRDSASALAMQIVIGVPVCMAGPSLSLARLRKIRLGDALLLDQTTYYLRVPLRTGVRRIALKFNGEQILIDRPMIDDEKHPMELTSELIPLDALTFAFDAVLGTLSLSLHELSRLRAGSIVSLQLPVRNRAVTLLCQGVPFAQGELIDIDDALGVRISTMTQLASPGLPE